jgi:hypothetical protein
MPTVAVPLFALRVAGERSRTPGAAQEVFTLGGRLAGRAVPRTAAQLAAVLAEVVAGLAAGKLFVNELVDGVNEAAQSRLHRHSFPLIACLFP